MKQLNIPKTNYDSIRENSVFGSSSAEFFIQPNTLFGDHSETSYARMSANAALNFPLSPVSSYEIFSDEENDQPNAKTEMGFLDLQYHDANNAAKIPTDNANIEPPSCNSLESFAMSSHEQINETATNGVQYAGAVDCGTSDNSNSYQLIVDGKRSIQNATRKLSLKHTEKRNNTQREEYKKNLRSASVKNATKKHKEEKGVSFQLKEDKFDCENVSSTEKNNSNKGSSLVYIDHQSTNCSEEKRQTTYCFLCSIPGSTIEYNAEILNVDIT